MSDYINRQEAIDRLSEVLSSEEEFERAKQAIIEAPTLDEKEIIRKMVERVVEKLEENYDVTNWDKPYAITLEKAIKIVKEECGINE